MVYRDYVEDFESVARDDDPFAIEQYRTDICDYRIRLRKPLEKKLIDGTTLRITHFESSRQLFQAHGFVDKSAVSINIDRYGKTPRNGSSAVQSGILDWVGRFNDMANEVAQRLNEKNIPGPTGQPYPIVAAIPEIPTV